MDLLPLGPMICAAGGWYIDSVGLFKRPAAPIGWAGQMCKRQWTKKHGVVTIVTGVNYWIVLIKPIHWPTQEARRKLGIDEDRWTLLENSLVSGFKHINIQVLSEVQAASSHPNWGTTISAPSWRTTWRCCWRNVREQIDAAKKKSVERPLVRLCSWRFRKTRVVLQIDFEKYFRVILEAK